MPTAASSAADPAREAAGEQRGAVARPGASFRCCQLEFGFLLGPADGRYLIRAAPEASPEFVVVLRTLGAPRRRVLERRRKPRESVATEAPEVSMSRASVIDADPLPSAGEADAWLRRLRGDRDGTQRLVERTTRQLDRLMRAHRAAAADPYARDLRPELATRVRVGHGSGDQVADGRFASAYEVAPAPKRERRASRLSPQEHLAAMVGGREELLAADELVLRARSDLAAGRRREAALQARIALECVLEELSGEALGDLAAELEGDRAGVSEAATAALSGPPDDSLAAHVAASVSRMETALRRHRAISAEASRTGS